MWSQDFVMRKELAMLYEIQAIGFPVFAHNKEESVPYASGGPGAVGNNADGSIIFERVHQFTAAPLAFSLLEPPMVPRPNFQAGRLSFCRPGVMKPGH